MLGFLDTQVNVCPVQAEGIKAVGVTGRITGNPSIERRGRSVEHRPRATKSNCFGLNGLGPGTS
jgi:hypothetical protein